MGLRFVALLLQRHRCNLGHLHFHHQSVLDASENSGCFQRAHIEFDQGVGDGLVVTIKAELLVVAAVRFFWLGFGIHRLVNDLPLGRVCDVLCPDGSSAITVVIGHGKHRSGGLATNLYSWLEIGNRNPLLFLG